MLGHRRIYKMVIINLCTSALLLIKYKFVEKNIETLKWSPRKSFAYVILYVYSLSMMLIFSLYNYVHIQYVDWRRWIILKKKKIQGWHMFVLYVYRFRWAQYTKKKSTRKVKEIFKKKLFRKKIFFLNRKASAAFHTHNVFTWLHSYSSI